MPSNSKKGLTVAVAIALFGGLGGYQAYHRMQHSDQVREETLEAAVPHVSVVHPQSGPASEHLSLPGSLTAWHQAPIYAQVAGYVKAWHKDYGAQVKEGELLAEIKTPTIDADYAKAKADLNAAEAEYNLAAVTARRWTALRSSQAVSEQAISEKQAHARARKAEVEAARQNLARFEALQQFKHVVAPFDGIVISRSINVGDYVDEGGNVGPDGDATELFAVADVHTMRLFVSVPEVFASILKPGLSAEVEVPQYPNRHFEARFLTTANGFDTNTRTAVTEFLIDNPDNALWPGSYATVSLTAPTDGHILTVPTSALVFEEDGLQVATVTADSRIHFKPVKSGKILGEQTQILQGLTRADQVADNPPAGLMEGEQVIQVAATRGYNSHAPAATEEAHE